MKNTWIGLALVALLAASNMGHSQTLGISPSGGETVGGFVAQAVDYDASNDWMRRNAALDGKADDDQGVLSYWYRRDGSDNSNLTFMSSNAFVKQHHILATNFYNNRLHNTAAQIVFFDENSDAVPVASANWHHVLLAWDLSVPTCQIYIDDSAGTIDDVCSSAGTGSNTASDWYIASNNGSGTILFDGCLSEVYFNGTDYLDISVEANRRKFNDGTGGTAGGKPVDLGSDGSTPTGNSPYIYFNQNAASRGTNAGTGGNFTVQGALDDCSSAPSD